MHVVLVAPLVSVIHDDLTPLGGAQAFVADLAHGLVASNHRVTLLAATGSHVRGTNIPELGIDSAGLRPARFNSPAARTDTHEQTEAFGLVRRWLDAHGSDVDVVHGHAYDGPAFQALNGLPIPVLHTLHLPPLDRDVVASVRDARTSAFVCVSEASANQWRDQGIPVRPAILPGIKIEEVPFRAASGSFLLFAGRITAEKGPDQAIDTAQALGIPLIVAGDIYDRDYFVREIQPRVHSDDMFNLSRVPTASATYIGPQSREQLLKIMAHAAGLLVPSIWDEPFGLVAVEAQAAGTPVAAYRRGGLAEVVAEGVTGWLAAPNDRADFVNCARKLILIQRKHCRDWVAAQFSMSRTITQYIELYEQLVMEGHRR
ncbi:MAG: glycosyltransferase [Chloroflexota bacterium]